MSLNNALREQEQKESLERRMTRVNRRHLRCQGWCRAWLPLLLKLLLVVMLIGSVPPLRNYLLYPVWPTQWRNIGTYKLIHMHVSDFFYPMNLQPYVGPCDDVAAEITRMKILETADELNKTFRIFRSEEWDAAEVRLRARYDEFIGSKLGYFRPALTEPEQRQLLRALFIATASLEAFNISYVVAEGTLIGAARHGGLIPWDDDGDILFKAAQWELARRVLSCIPGFQLKIHSDFLWKFFAADSSLWKDESVTRFPYVDLFPYVEDSEHVWPLVIWLKDKMLWPREQVFPTRHVMFDNFRVRAPWDLLGVLSHLFGDVQKCESRLFERRERRLVPHSERMSIDCKLLYGVYPFLDKPAVLEQS